jgi:hypothetical protein
MNPSFAVQEQVYAIKSELGNFFFVASGYGHRSDIDELSLWSPHLGRLVALLT